MPEPPRRSRMEGSLTPRTPCSQQDPTPAWATALTSPRGAPGGISASRLTAGPGCSRGDPSWLPWAQGALPHQVPSEPGAGMATARCNGKRGDAEQGAGSPDRPALEENGEDPCLYICILLYM